MKEYLTADALKSKFRIDELKEILRFLKSEKQIKVTLTGNKNDLATRAYAALYGEEVQKSTKVTPKKQAEQLVKEILSSTSYSDSDEEEDYRPGFTGGMLQVAQMMANATGSDALMSSNELEHHKLEVTATHGRDGVLCFVGIESEEHLKDFDATVLKPGVTPETDTSRCVVVQLQKPEKNEVLTYVDPDCLIWSCIGDTNAAITCHMPYHMPSNDDLKTKTGLVVIGDINYVYNSKNDPTGARKLAAFKAGQYFKDMEENNDGTSSSGIIGSSYKDIPDSYSNAIAVKLNGGSTFDGFRLLFLEKDNAGQSYTYAKVQHAIFPMAMTLNSVTNTHIYIK